MKTVEDLRAALFDTLADLRAGKIDVEKAKAVSEIAQTIINTAKVEVEHAKAVGGTAGSQFLGAPAPKPQAPGVRGVVTHRLQG